MITDQKLEYTIQALSQSSIIKEVRIFVGSNTTPFKEELLDWRKNQEFIDKTKGFNPTNKATKDIGQEPNKAQLTERPLKDPPLFSTNRQNGDQVETETYVVFPQEVSTAGSPGGADAPKLAGTSLGGMSGILMRLTAHFRTEVSAGGPQPTIKTASTTPADPRPAAQVLVLPVLGVLLVTGQQEVADHLSRDPDVGAVVASSSVVARLPEVTPETASVQGMWHLASIGADSAHQAGIDGRGIWVGVADSGLEASHPEFEGREVLFCAFDPAGKATQQTAFDLNGHGTHVAGIVAGRTAGVAPGAGLAVASVLPHGSGMFAQILAGLEWLASVKRPDGGTGVDIINLSVQVFTPLADGSSRGLCKPFEGSLRRLRALGIEVIAAAGNYGPGTLASPGNFPSVIGVGAVDRSGGVWSGSGSGAVPEAGGITKPDVLAPGVDVLSAAHEKTPGTGRFGLVTMTGTSMATPAVSGLAALLLQQAGPEARLDLRAELSRRSVGSQGGIPVARY